MRGETETDTHLDAERGGKLKMQTDTQTDRHR